ncbi:MAG: hypothetical protein U0136_00245 [Bdellovibrionota bacterium]
MEKLRLPDSLLGLLAQVRPSADSVQPWSTPFRERNYAEALKLIEQELEHNPSDSELRLWWIALQLELNQVPLTALSSPLLEIFPTIKNDTRLQRPALGVLLSLTSRLAEKGSLRLGMVILEHAGELASLTEGLSGAQTADLHSYTLLYLREEIARAEGRRENKDYIARLKQKEQQLATKTPEPPKERKPKEKRKPLSAKTIYTAAEVEASRNDEHGGAPLAEREMNQLEITPLPSVPVGTTDASLNRSAASEELERKKTARKSLAVGLIAAGFCFLGLKALYDLFSPHSSAGGELVLAMTTRVEVPGELSLPNAELNAHDKLARKIESLGTSADQIGERIKQLTPKPGDKSLDELSQDPGVDQAALSSKEASKLKPAQPDELASIDGPKTNDVQAAPVDARRTPRLDPAGLASIPVDRLDRTPPPPPRPNLQVGPDGRVYGPPQDQDPAGAPEAGRALDGSPLRSYEVQEFPEPQLYKTIASTNVLAAPSLLSSSVSRLERDTTIHVVSRMGQWLELRSNQGRRGYIFAQDAVPAQ